MLCLCVLADLAAKTAALPFVQVLLEAKNRPCDMFPGISGSKEPVHMRDRFTKVLVTTEESTFESINRAPIT